MPMSSASPSLRYSELLAQYRKLHREGEPSINLPTEKTFPGTSVFPQARRIKAMIEKSGATSLLDYGCGKGQQYEARAINVPDAGVFESLQDFWDIDYIFRYDPAYEKFSRRPETTFDGVICTDVLEHCPAEDLPWIVRELFSFANKFVFASVAGHAAKKTLPNGENAHCTQKPGAWWQDLFEAVSSEFPAHRWELWHHVKNANGGFDEICVTRSLDDR